MAGKKQAAKTIGEAKENPAQEYFEWDIRGERLKFCFTFRKIVAAVQQMRRLGMTTNLSASVANIDIDNVTWLTAVALAVYQPKLTFDQVAELVDHDTIYDLRYAIEQAFILAYPKADKKNPPEAAAGQTSPAA